MYSIGAFAQLGGVTVRMLRHNDGTGLLAPAYVDPATGHRLYGAAQLLRFNRLVALKDLGIALEQIGRLLDDGVEPAELRGMVRKRAAELEHGCSRTARPWIVCAQDCGTIVNSCGLGPLIAASCWLA